MYEYKGTVFSVIPERRFINGESTNTLRETFAVVVFLGGGRSASFRVRALDEIDIILNWHRCRVTSEM